MTSLNSHSFWRTFSVVTTFLVATTQLYAFGDYSLKIDDDYQIVRANQLQVSLSRISTHDLVYYWDMFPATGPIDSYKVTPTHIFLWVYGRKLRNHFPGDTFEDVDPLNQSYLILDKSDQKLVGPLNQADIQAHPIIQSAGEFSWIKARNPDPFAGVTFLFYYLMFWGPWQALFPILILVTLLILFFRSKKDSQTNP